MNKFYFVTLQKSRYSKHGVVADAKRELYVDFLKSEEVVSILEGKRNLLYGIDVLRKISNHPDLLLRESSDW